MELRQYIRIIVTSWWLIIPITLLAFVTAMLFSYSQTPIYEAASTYVTQLNPEISQNNVFYGLDTLTGRDRIYVTFCNVMTSEAVFTEALRIMNITTLDIPSIEQYKTTCNVLPSSNIIMLITVGPSETLIERLNQAIGLAGTDQANRIYGTFQVSQLDPTKRQLDPISPSHSRSAILGIALGLVTSITMSILLDYLRSPLEKIEAQAVRDGLLNVYNDRYFKQRLGEEIRRSRSRQRPLSIAYSKLMPTEDFALLPENIQESMKRVVVQFMEDRLGESDFLSYNRKTDTFMLLLPETNNSEARDTMVKMHQDMTLRSFQYGDYIANFELDTGIVESSGENLTTERISEKAQKAITKAQQTPKSKLIFLRDAPNPFVVEGSGEEAEEFIEVPVTRAEFITGNAAKADGIAPSFMPTVAAPETVSSPEELNLDPETFERVFGRPPKKD